MNAAQIDQALENLMLELQSFKRSSTILTEAGVKVEEVIAAAEAIVRLGEQIRSDNRRQVEAVQNYTAKSEQKLAALVTSVSDTLSQQIEAQTAFEQTVQQKVEVLAASIETVQTRQKESLAKLEQSLQQTMQEQSRRQRTHIWLLFTFVLLTLLTTGASLWVLVVAASGG